VELKAAVSFGAVALAVPCLAAAQQTSDAGLFRLYQGGAEVGRESFRWSGDTLESTTRIPILGARIESRIERSGGRLGRLEVRAFALGPDTLLQHFVAAADGDSIVTQLSGPGRPERTRRFGITAHWAAPPQLVTPLIVVAEAVGRRDTTLHLFSVGSDTAVMLNIAFRGDTAALTSGPLVINAVFGVTGRVETLEIPAQRVRVERFRGDSLPPLAGLTRPAPDYSAPPGAPYTAEEVRIPVRTSGGDTLSLAGTLTLPRAGRPPHPVAVTISGSGRQPRDEELWPLLADYRPFRQIAERLAEIGFGVLRYDDRGVDSSTGGAIEATTADYADEVRHIVAWLRGRRDVDAGRIVLIGHSEGGVIGPIVAADDRRIAAVVIMAGPARSGRSIVRDQMRRPIETAVGLTPEQRTSALDAAERQVEEWANLNSWSRFLADYDPLPMARRLRQPVLILQGELDRQVSAGQADTLASAIRAAGNRDVTVRVFPRLNHLFVATSGDGSPTEYASLRDPRVANEVLDVLADWLRTRLVRRR
jgi:hypothetical protein